MSISLMSMIWRIEFPTQSQLLVALKLADYANDDGANVYPARASIARLAQCSESTVKAVLRAFRDIGLLHVVEEGGKGPKSTTKYTFHMRLLHSLHRGDCLLSGDSETLKIEWPDKGAEFDPLKGPEFDPLEEKRGQPGELRGQPTPDKGSASRPQSINNHHKEPSRADTRASCDARAMSAAKSQAPKPAFQIRPGEAAFAAWVEHLHKIGRGRLADWARDEGVLNVTKRWPSGDDLPLDNPSFEPEGLSELSKRMMGEVDDNGKAVS